MPERERRKGRTKNRGTEPSISNKIVFDSLHNVDHLAVANRKFKISPSVNFNP
jgi:hypothetical protein